MATAESLPAHSNQHRSLTPKTRGKGELGTSSATILGPTMRRPHENSLASVSRDQYLRISTGDDRVRSFPSSLLSNRNLLVSRRLALKRQRAAMKGPSLHYEPLRSETFQMELGNPEDPVSANDRHTLASASVAHQRHEPTQSTSHHSTPVSGETPHTAPADISLMYREKPTYSHPITGQFLVHYAENQGNPSPCAYVLPRKSCREKNAPAYTFGTRCLVEKKGGSRTAWQKQWFAHSNPFTTKVDFGRENNWPTPFHYPARPSLGFQSTKVSFPAWSIGTRLESSPTFLTDDKPSPDTYDITRAFRKLTAKSVPITLKSRTGGTQISTNLSAGLTPGPGAHDDRKFLSNRHSAPKHSFGQRIPVSLRQDPYVNLIQPNRV